MLGNLREDCALNEFNQMNHKHNKAKNINRFRSTSNANHKNKLHNKCTLNLFKFVDCMRNIHIHHEGGV